MSFLAATAVLGVIWLAYHVPLVLAGDYGSAAGLPAFALGIVGFTLFIGVITDLSRSLWPSVLAHGVWNATVQDSFAVPGSDEPAFTGSAAMLGEFGWIPAISVFLLGVVAAVWHLRRGRGGVLVPVGRSSASLSAAA